MYLMCSSEKGIRSSELARTLGVHKNTARRMRHLSQQPRGVAVQQGVRVV
jgi:predicted ArsR family transcriptional regulator